VFDRGARAEQFREANKPISIPSSSTSNSHLLVPTNYKQRILKFIVHRFIA